MGASEGAGAWPVDVYAALGAQDVRQVAYVPDAGLTELLGL